MFAIDNPLANDTPTSSEPWLKDQTFYVKVDPDFTTLSITTVGCADVDNGQVFIFNVKNVSALDEDVNLTVTVVGNGTITIDRLRPGEYVVTELTDWSYRYTPDSTEKSITLSVTQANTLTFSQIRTVTHWLDGNASAKNDFNS